MNKKFIIPIIATIAIIVAIAAGLGIWWLVSHNKPNPGGNMDNQSITEIAKLRNKYQLSM